MYLGDPVLERNALDVILYLAIAENALQANELPLVESLGELGEIPPGVEVIVGALVTVESEPMRQFGPPCRSI